MSSTIIDGFFNSGVSPSIQSDCNVATITNPENDNKDLDELSIPQCNKIENMVVGSTENIVSRDGVNGLMKLLFQRGYFQQCNQMYEQQSKSQQNSNKCQRIPTVLYEDKNDFEQPTYISHTPVECDSGKDTSLLLPDSFMNYHTKLVPIIETTATTTTTNILNDCEAYATVNVLVERLRQVIFNESTTAERRWTISDISTLLRVSIPSIIYNIIPKLLNDNCRSTPPLNLRPSEAKASQVVDCSSVPKILLVHDNRCFPPILSKTTSTIISLPDDDVTSFLSILTGQSQVMTEQYFNMKFEILRTEIICNKTKQNSVTLSYVCDKVYNLPTAIVFPILQNQIARQHINQNDNNNSTSSNDIDRTTLLHIKQNEKGNSMIMSNFYWLELQREVISTFEVIVDMELSLSKIASDNNWDSTWVNDIIRQACNLNQLQARVILQSDENIYRPNQYDEKQRQNLWDYYNSEGYVTSYYAKHCLHVSSTNQMKDFIQQQYEKVRKVDPANSPPIIINETIFHPIILLEPLQLLIQDAAATSSWSDLTQTIPIALLEQTNDDLHTLFMQHIFERKGNNDDVLSDGVLCIEKTTALYFSNEMITAFTNTRLPTIGESFSKDMASQIVEQQQQNKINKPTLEDDLHNVDDTKIILSGKEKFKQRNERKICKQSSKRKNDEATTYTFDDDEDCLQLVPMIVQALVEEFFDLKDIGEQKYDEAKTLPAILFTFCRQAFVSDTLKSSITRMTRMELVKKMNLFANINSTRSNSSTSYCVQSLGPLLIDMHEIQQAFEDPSCFASSCYMIQSAYKVLVYAKESCSSDTNAPILQASDIHNLEKDFLTGCCADFTRRLTQYCIQKHNVDEDCPIMIRRLSGDETVGQELPYYYDTINISTQRYSKVYLCTSNNKNPLIALRDSLPGSIGVALARQWMLCGGECYQGGVKENNSDTITRPGDCDAFMQHVHDNCLPVCGLPFTKLEKKLEKKFLADRRQILIRHLEDLTVETATVFELTIMLLYQSIKNMVVFGSQLKGPILQMLLKERKLTNDIRDILSTYDQKLRDGEAIDTDLIHNLKLIALGKDGTKKN
jgi:E3 UFM1-protein ligase 1